MGSHVMNVIKADISLEPGHTSQNTSGYGMLLKLQEIFTTVSVLPVGDWSQFKIWMPDTLYHGDLIQLYSMRETYTLNVLTAIYF